MYGLIIKKRWLDLIMSGKKTLEIRGCRTSHVGEEIALLESGSQKIRGFCTIKEVMDLDKGKWEVHRDRHCVDVPWENLIKRYKTPYAWHLSAITPKEGLTYLLLLMTTMKISEMLKKWDLQHFLLWKLLIWLIAFKIQIWKKC